MPEYSIPEQVPRRWIAVLWAVLTAAAIGGLVCLYGQVGTGAAFVVAAHYTAVLLAGGFFYASATRFVPSVAGRVGLVLSVLALGLGAGWGVSAAGWMTSAAFARLVPLLVVSGGASWLGLALLLRRRPAADEADAVDETPEPLPADSPPAERRETIDRIPVKKGSDIHIVRVDELLYAQAEGDYVWLFTPEGRFLKEQTMRWLAEHLPDHFVRIHRSTIVNIDRIARVELFGKENYHVRLGSGTVLKASLSGYRALKIRLNL